MVFATALHVTGNELIHDATQRRPLRGPLRLSRPDRGILAGTLELHDIKQTYFSGISDEKLHS